MTIEEAKQDLRDNWEEGLDCPCCGQRVQLYVHSLNGAMIRSLIELYKLDKENPSQKYFHISKFEQWRNGYGGGQFAKTKHWGLSLDRDNVDEEKHSSGMWAITDRGRDFIERKVAVPGYVRIYNKKSYGFTGDPVDVESVLAKRFNYKELMGDYYFDLPLPSDLKWMKQERFML